MDGAADEYSQWHDLFEALACPKEYVFFEATDLALQHCQVGAQHPYQQGCSIGWMRIYEQYKEGCIMGGSLLF